MGHHVSEIRATHGILYWMFSQTKSRRKYRETLPPWSVSVGSDLSVTSAPVPISICLLIALSVSLTFFWVSAISLSVGSLTTFCLKKKKNQSTLLTPYPSSYFFNPSSYFFIAFMTGLLVSSSSSAATIPHSEALWPPWKFLWPRSQKTLEC